MTDTEWKILQAHVARIADALEAIARAQDPTFKTREEAIQERRRPPKAEESARDR